MIWEGLGLHLKGVWDSLVCLLCTFRRFLTVFLVFEIALFSSIGLRWGPRDLLEKFWIDFGSILEGSGKVFGGFWKGLEGVWEDFGPYEQVVGRFWKCLA